MAKRKMVIVPERKVGDKVILPVYKLAVSLAYPYERCYEVAPKSPTPLQLRQAYETSPQIREAIDNTAYVEGYPYHLQETLNIAIGPGEGDKQTIITPVERFIRPKNCREIRHGWQAEGKRIQRKLPESGFQGADGGVLYHQDDGLPVRTYESRDEAIDSILKAGIAIKHTTAGNLASYWRKRDEFTEFANVGRVFRSDRFGPWHLTCWNPTNKGYAVGFRVIDNAPFVVTTEMPKTVNRYVPLSNGAIGDIERYLRALRDGKLQASEIPERARGLLKTIRTQ